MENDWVIGNCILRATSFRAHSEKIENQEFPSPEPIYLATALANTAQALAEYLVKIRKQPYYNPTANRGLIRTIDGIVKWLFELLRYSDGAMTSKVPWSLVGPLQNLSARLLPDTVLILRPKWRYNYAVLMSDIVATIKDVVKNVLSTAKLDECFRGLRHNLQIVSFPYLEKKSIFLHAALAHEIGHLIAEQFIIADKSELPTQLRDRIISDVKADTSILPLYRTREITHRLRECARYRKRALQELGSDLVAVNMLGPAALFSLYGIIGMRNLDDVPSPQHNRYPPRRQRIRIMLRELQDYLPGLANLSHLDELTPDNCNYILSAYKEHIEQLQKIASSTSDQAALKTDRIVDIAYQWVEQSLQNLRQYVRAHCSGKSEVSLSAEHDDKQLEAGTGFWLKVCDLTDLRLNRGLPPNILDDIEDPPKPASFEAIMNAGWLFLISKIPQLPENINSIREFTDKHQQAERLTLRAFELSNIQTVYNSRYLGKQ